MVVKHYCILLVLVHEAAFTRTFLPLLNEIQSKPDLLDYRLPRNIKPNRYIITLEPNLEPDSDPATYNGSIEIELMALENTKNITLHVKELNITESSIFIVDYEGLNASIAYTTTYTARDFYIIHLENALKSNHTYRLIFGNFSGELNLQNRGFYLAKYTDQDGNERRLATTQFESIDARRAFPCFDEPALKATFTISLIRKEGYNSIANGDYVNTINLGNGRYQDVFNESLIMSTYLVAFVVSDFSYVENTEENQRVYARSAEILAGTAEYGLKQGINILNAFQNHFQVNYSLNKMYQVAFPDEYFSVGAMENWGLVTYWETFLLYSNHKSTTLDKQSTVNVISHEYAHQWFGNLVTASWWKYIWLNEGFAQYYQYYGTAMIEPEWRCKNQFVVDTLHAALFFDSHEDTQPLNYESPTQGAGPQATVQYYKGGSVIRMFEHFLTRRVFNKGLTIYLSSRQFMSAEPSHLYASLQDALDNANKTSLLGGLTVSSILSTWDSIKGYPVVNVIRDYKTGHLSLSQSKFRLENKTDANDDIWYIPITYTFQNWTNISFIKTTVDYWLVEKRHTIETKFPTDGWVIVNKKQAGFYRVNYDVVNWNRIINYLINMNFRTIHVLNRAQLLDDAFHLARSGRLEYNIPLNITKYLQKEQDYIPFAAFFQTHSFLEKMLAATEEYTLYKRYVVTLLSGAFTKLGLDAKENDTHLDKLLRNKVLTLLCNYDHYQCKNYALSKLRTWINDENSPILPDFQVPYYCGALKFANETDWDFLYKKYDESQSNLVRSRILNSLGCITNETILEKFLDKVRLNILNKPLDWNAAFASVYNSGTEGLKFTFSYIQRHFIELNELMDLTGVLTGLATRFTTQEQYNKLNDLADIHNESRSKFELARKTVLANLNWANKYVVHITDWLRDLPHNDMNVKYV